jgi:predicted phosphoribosyltransferase
MTGVLFRNRGDAGRRLAEALRDVPLVEPLVLAIPRGGIEVGAALADALGAELDVVLSRKLRAPGQPELALGALSETGEVHLDEGSVAATEAGRGQIERERAHQAAEIRRSAALFRGVRPPARIAGRSVIVTDDGLATGSTMIAALRTVGARGAGELLCAVPVGPPERLADVRPLCDRLVCLAAPQEFRAVGQFYGDFSQVSDERAVALLAGRGSPLPRRDVAGG